ncbi:MAG: anthranilate synthase component I [Deltaproteobacteria bacterium]|nr:anthranilate synthase component I [Deltaproteobacteria bacterium]
MILIDRETFVRLAGEFPLVPVGRRVPADTETPVSTYLKVANRPWSFLLESVEGGTRWGRYSIVGLDPFATVEISGTEARVTEEGFAERVGAPLDEIRSFLRCHRMPRLPELPRFLGGLVGYIGYRAAGLFERLPDLGPDPAGLPDIRLFAPRKLLAFDNVRKTLDVLVLARPGADAGAAYDHAMEEIDGVLAALRWPLPESDVFPPCCPAPEMVPTMARERFEAIVEEAREAIFAGEAIQIVLSQAFEGETGIKPLTAYRALRALNPSPYLFHIAFGEETLVGASPEVMVRVEEGRATLRPIAGTRPRGENAAEDARLEEELLADEKERAEHVMLVDLGRNDLGRVARPGAVRLEESFVVERYSHVMHLVSTVSAELREGADGLDVLAATFPAGTVSGAPKVRAMELIAELEGRPRGVYSGAVGYLGFDGNLDTCIAIRTLVFHRGCVTVQAGAGIVADSNPAREYEETLHKARALRRALEVAAAGLAPEG